MSDKNNLFSDDILKDLESLKSRYSDYEKDDEPIRKPVKRAEPPKSSRSAADPGFGVKEKKPAAPAPKEKAAEAPVKKAPTAGKPAPEKKPAPVKKAEPSAKPAADNELSVFDGLILTDNGSSIYNNEKPAEEAKANRKPVEKKAEKAESKTNNNKKRKKKKSHKLRNALLIVFIAAVLWGTLFAIDLVYVSHWQDPIFCKKTAEYENGSKDFTGLFYKVQYHVDDNGDISTECMPWFFKGSNDEFKEAEKKGADKTPETTEAPVSTPVSSSVIDVTIPKEYFDGDLSEGIELTAEQKASGYTDVALNGDGSVTYQLNEAGYEREIQKIKADTEAKLQGLVADTDFPSIKKVECNDDFSEVSLYVDKAVYQTGLDSFVSQSVSTWVGFYQSFANQSLVCNLSILDYTDGSVIEQSKG